VCSVETATEVVVNAISLWFNQPGYVANSTIESFVIKILKAEDYSTELKFLESRALKAQLVILKHVSM